MSFLSGRKRGESMFAEHKKYINEVAQEDLVLDDEQFRVFFLTIRNGSDPTRLE